MTFRSETKAVRARHDNINHYCLDYNMTGPDRLTRRKLLDHERYMQHREERKKKQREYYASHREQCIASVLRCVNRYKMEFYERRE